MANPRDTGDNVKVDFVWGNVPMQPNDDRGENTLDPELDNHIIVTTEWNGFPGYTPTSPYLDTVENATVPNVVGLTESAATTALTNASLVKGAVTTTAVGATSGNNNQVKTQTPAAGTKVNEGTSVALVKYAYVAPPIIGPTTDWSYVGSTRRLYFNAVSTMLSPFLNGSAVFGRPVVITGGSLAGSYLMSNGALDTEGSPTKYYVVLQTPGLGASNVEGSVDGGSASITLG